MAFKNIGGVVILDTFVKHEGIVAPLNRANVDTDAIVPKQFLKRLERTGLGQFLFYEWRYQEDGMPNRSFVLNQPHYEKASILLARENFGTGSSREHAPWALMDYGFKVIIAPSYAEIFYNNCFKNGILPIELDEEIVDELFQKTATHVPYKLSVDLTKQTISDQTDFQTTFSIDRLLKERLLKGLDDIAVTFQFKEKIEEFERERVPWLDPYK